MREQRRVEELTDYDVSEGTVDRIMGADPSDPLNAARGVLHMIWMAFVMIVVALTCAGVALEARAQWTRSPEGSTIWNDQGCAWSSGIWVCDRSRVPATERPRPREPRCREVEVRDLQTGEIRTVEVCE